MRNIFNFLSAVKQEHGITVFLTGMNSGRTLGLLAAKEKGDAFILFQDMKIRRDTDQPNKRRLGRCVRAAFKDCINNILVTD